MVDAVINPKITKVFQERGISQETLELGGIYTGRRQNTGDKWEIHPDINGEIIVYPYFRGGEVVNTKYRTEPKNPDEKKKFYQSPGGRKTFWNADILDDPSLHDGTNRLVIVEGENDALACIESGYPFVVSVPDGAPPPKNTPEVEEIDPKHDDKYQYIFNDWESIQKIKRIVIAVDDDPPGKRLADELTRRLGKIRCSFVSFPPGCKDLNDVLVEHGPQAVLDVLGEAREYPISGIYTFSELPVEPDLEPMSTGWRNLDVLIKPFFPALMVVTGVANSGKSTWVNQMVAQMNLQHDVKVAIASFEMRINPFVSGTLLAVYKYFRSPLIAQKRNPEDAEAWLNKNFVFIAPEPGDDNSQFDIEWLIEKAEAAVLRHGIRILVIDPWNEIEHAVGRRESTTEYVGRAIRALKRFGRETGCLVIVVAHPSKYGAAKAEKDPPEKINLYDISDTAHFANKADFGVTINRSGEIDITKIRYQPVSGTIGSQHLAYKDKMFN